MTMDDGQKAEYSYGASIIFNRGRGLHEVVVEAWGLTVCMNAMAGSNPNAKQHPDAGLLSSSLTHLSSMCSTMLES